MKYRKVLVTGSAGFIGSHVADTLEENGYHVILFDAVPSKFKTKTQKEFIGDILNPSDIEKAMEDCHTIYHFAAQADIGASSDTPTGTITSNIIGTQNVIDANSDENYRKNLNKELADLSETELWGVAKILRKLRN